jgi:glycosyltransferase involved in cell wall biosynthesis
MKILYLCPDLGIPVLGRKGASTHVRELIAALSRVGHSVVLVTPSLSKSPWERPAALDATLVHLRPSDETLATVRALQAFNDTLGVENSLPGELHRILYNDDLAAQVKCRFESAPPDFIYERASLYATAGVWLAREFHVPLVIELNAPLALEESTYRAAGLGEVAAQAERWTLLQAHAVLAVSSPLRDYAVSLGIDPGRAHVLPNGVDPELFQLSERDARLRARLGLTDAPVLGFVGGLRPWHDVQALPAVADRLVRRHPDLRLIIVGDGPLRGQLEATFRDLGIARNALFTGALPHDEIPGVIRQFDVALAPYTRPEHAFYFSPLKLFEYMACGVPVVAARLGQIGEVVRHGETGLLYPPGDIDALTDACEQLLGDTALRCRLGQAAAKETRGRYTWDHNAARIVELARSLIERRGPPP